MTTELCGFRHRQVVNAIRAKDDLGNFEVFSALLNTDLEYYEDANLEEELESLIFGDSNNGNGGENHVGATSHKTIILSNMLKGQLGNELLHIAACCGNSFIVKCLIRLGVSVDAFDDICNFNTPLMTALQGRSNEKTIQTLLDLGANICDNTPSRSCPLKICLSHTMKHWKNLKLILERIKRDYSNKSDATAEKLLNSKCMIYHAVLLKDLEILRIMLKSGCSITDRDRKSGKNALHMAVLVKDLDVIKFLLKNGADINAVDAKGMSPFALAIDYGESAKECEILNYLLDQENPLDIRYFNYYEQQMCILYKGKKPIVYALLSRRCVDFNIRSVFGMTSLHYIAQNCHLVNDQRIVEYLQQHRIDVNALDHDKWTPLMLAASLKNVSLAKYLLQNGANVNQQNNLNISALYLASVYDRNKINVCNLVELLLLYGADSQLSDINNVKDLTVIDKIIKEESYYLAKPILAYLVLHVANGGEIAEFIRRKIDSNEKLRNKLEFCQKDLEDMKEIKVNESLTAYNLMLYSDKRIMFILRNEEMFSLLKNFYSTFSSDSYYIHLLKQRLEKIFQEIKVRQRAANFLYNYFTLDYVGFPEIIDKIIDYFNPQDLQTLFHM